MAGREEAVLLWLSLEEIKLERKDVGVGRKDVGVGRVWTVSMPVIVSVGVADGLCRCRWLGRGAVVLSDARREAMSFVDGVRRCG